jgi:hypothetical protein
MASDLSERFEMRASAEWLEAVDGWRRKQADIPSRGEAIRRLVEMAVALPQKPRRTTPANREAKARSAEKHAHDYMDKALKGETETVKSQRKKSLTSLPSGYKRR